MTHDPRSAEFDDELLSAYLDDELSPAERALVEERLASDPTARALLEQLRGVSHSLKALPTEKLDGELSGSVLAAAERAMLTASPAYPRIAPDPDTSHDGVSPTEELPPFSFGRTRRGWFWAAAALAAALLIAFVEPEGEEEKIALREPAATKNLRIGDVEMRSLDRAEGEEATAAERPLDEAKGRDLDAVQDQLAEEAHADRNDDSARMAEFRESPDDHYFAEDSPPPPPSAPPMEEPPSPSDDALAERSGATDPGVADLGIATRMKGPAREVERAEVPAAPAPPSRSDAPADTARSSLAVAAPEGENRHPSREAETGVTGAMRPEGDADSSNHVAASPIIVVQLSAKPDAFRDRSIDRLLVDHGIAVEEMPTGEAQTGADDTAAKEALGESGSNPAVASDEATRTENLDIVSVEASPAQVEALLATLQKDEANFSAVDVRAPVTFVLGTERGPAEDWARFNRGSLSYGFPAGQATARGGGYGAIAGASPPPPADVQARGAAPSEAAIPAQASESPPVAPAPRTSFGRSQPEEQGPGGEGRIGRARRFTDQRAADQAWDIVIRQSPQDSEPGDRSQSTERSDLAQRVESAEKESATRAAPPQGAGIEQYSATLPSERLFQTDNLNNINVLFLIRPEGAPQPTAAPPPSAEETE